ncbi:hypothetical protein DRO44_04270, partial [Candidatus Bathyarchaeota archaeon]
MFRKTLCLLLLTFIVASNIMIFQVHSQDTAVIYVNPPLIEDLAPSQTFTIDVVVANVSDLYGVDIRFSWDPTILEYVSHTAKIPVEDYPDGILHEPGLLIKDEVDATEGTYWLAYASMSPAPAFDGTGIAFNMTFKIISLSGACILHIDEDSKLSDSKGDPLKGGWEIKDGLFIPAG